MPVSETLKPVWAAVRDIERTIEPTYPQHFDTIDAAKEHIKKLCLEAKFEFSAPRLRPSDPPFMSRAVKDRACFLVAVRAHDQGEFYLEEPLPDRKSLRDAIETDIARLLLLVHAWPTGLANADLAAKWVSGMCAVKKFEFTRFEGVSEDKFQRYVTGNTARRAWEQSRIEVGLVPKEWVRKKVVKKAESLTEAIEIDIARLKPLIKKWPSTFEDLNAARDFVGYCGYDTTFRYTGWPSVELRKYKLFVNFNTAKYALKDGLFKVERAVPKRRTLNKTVGQERDGRAKQQNNVGIVEVKKPVSKKDGVARIHTTTDGTKNTSTADQDSSASSDEPARGGSTSSSTTTSETISSASSTHEEDSQKPAPADPFKNLIDELQRGYVLKAAFD